MTLVCRPTPLVRFMPMSEQGSKINSCIAWHTKWVHGSVFTRSPSPRNPYTIQLCVCKRTTGSIPPCNTPVNRVYSRHEYQTNNHAVYPARQRTHRTYKATVWVSIGYRCNTACSPIGGTWGDSIPTQTAFKGLASIPMTEVRGFTLGLVNVWVKSRQMSHSLDANGEMKYALNSLDRNISPGTLSTWTKS
jgi:hypothetical protein